MFRGNPALAPSAPASAGFWGWAAVVAAIAFAVRAVLAFDHMSVAGDGRIYWAAAENLWRHGCLSLSDPATAECLAHWGGNQPPGYIGLMVASWALLGHGENAIGLAQCLFTALAIVRAIQALRELCGSERTALGAGLLLAVSPAHLAWSAHVLTEAMAVATTIWVMAELALSLARGRLLVLPLSLALIAALFTRYDALALGLPVAAVTLMLRPLPTSLLRAVAIAVIVFAPLGAWFVHGLAKGLPLPAGRYLVTADLEPKPVGFFRWSQLWLHDQYEQRDTMWVTAARSYSEIRIPERAYGTQEERERVEALLAELREHTGEPFPPDVDAAFDELYAERVASDPLGRWVVHPSVRLTWLWLNPYTSLGWPAIGDETMAALREALSTREPGRIAAAIPAAAIAEPIAVLGKLLNTGYRYLLLLVVAVALIPIFRHGPVPVRIFAATALLYAVARSVTFALIGHTESRFVAEALPGLEMLAVLGASVWLDYRRAAVPP